MHVRISMVLILDKNGIFLIMFRRKFSENISSGYYKGIPSPMKSLHVIKKYLIKVR